MANITAGMVKELREMTGAGMMDCKNVLVEADGDMDKAVELLREKGLAKAAKKAGRVAAEGLVKLAFSDDAKKAAVIEVNSETDFVAKNDEFVDFVQTLANMAIDAEPDMDKFMQLQYTDEGTVQEALNNKIAKIGENMNIRRFANFSQPGCVYVGYVHGAGKIGVIVGLETEASAAEVEVVGKDVAMQVAALKPLYTSDSEVSAEYIEHEKEILMAQIQNDPKESQKPEKVIQGMITGRIKKELKEICLLDQIYVKAEDGKQSVGNYVAQVAKENGAKITIKGFVRYETGDGIEKKEENFAEEVAKQMGK